VVFPWARASKAINRMPAGGSAQTERLRQVRAQSVLEEERNAVAFIAIVKTNAVVQELSHGR
jgi:hypothetical protein